MKKEEWFAAIETRLEEALDEALPMTVAWDFKEAIVDAIRPVLLGSMREYDRYLGGRYLLEVSDESDAPR